MDQKLKALKVVDLKHILATAQAPAPAKATKSDLIARIAANEQAIAVYNDLYPSTTASKSQPSEETPPNPVATSPPKSQETSSSSQPSQSSPLSAPSNPPPAPAQTPLATTSTPIDPELEKRKQRAARFGIPLVEPSKQTQPNPPSRKSKQNGDATTKLKPPTNDSEKLNARAARFGLVTLPAQTAGKKRNAVEQADPEELERRRKRAERFGLVQPVTTK